MAPSPDARLPILDLADVFIVGSIENNGDRTSSVEVAPTDCAGEGAPNSERSFCLCSAGCVVRRSGLGSNGLGDDEGFPSSDCNVCLWSLAAGLTCWGLLVGRIGIVGKVDGLEIAEDSVVLGVPD